MKILAISDLHADFATFAPESLPDADVCLLAGDLTNVGMRRPLEVQACHAWFTRLGLRFPTLWIPGNHDFDLDFFSFATHADVICLYQNFMIYREVTFYGESLCTAFDMPQLAQQWAYTTADPEEDLRVWADAPPARIVVSHCPPFGILDGAGRIYTAGKGFGNTRHIGSPGLLHYIERHQPALVVVGHAHGNVGEARIGRTRVVNTAQTATLIELEIEPT